MSREGLVRGLGLGAATSVSLGAVIGSGIFVGFNRLAAGTPSVGVMLAVLVAAGALSMLGALVYAEFAAALPESGSDFVYVKRSLGPYWGFLSGWSTLTLNTAASVAAIAVAFATQLDGLKPDRYAFLVAEGFATKLTATAAIALFTLLNVLGVKVGGRVQAGLTALKVGLALALVGVGFWAWSGAGSVAQTLGDSHVPAGSFAAALVGAFFAVDGWTGVTRVSGEVRDPQRNLPRALVVGLLAVTALYVLLALAYVAALGIDGMAGDGSSDDRLVASRAAEAVLGAPGRTFVALVIIASTLGAVNGVTLSGPRVYFAMARHGLLWPALAKVDPKRHTPAAAILAQGTFAVLLVALFSFEQLTAYVVLSAWVSYLLAAIGLLAWRRREPDHPRPFRTPFSPWVPAAFAVFAAGILLYLVGDAVVQALAGTWKPLWLVVLNVAVLALSWPLYLTLRRRAAAVALGGPSGPA